MSKRRKERCFIAKQEYIKSPLNYIGGKYKLLGKLYKIFPDNIDTFVDMFAGGANVCINSDAKHIICNDQLTYLIDLYKYWQITDTEKIIEQIEQHIDEYNLSKVNGDGYCELRKEYNSTHDIIDFFVLICYSFNNQIRFNNKHEFNCSFGKNRSSFNDSIRNNLILFMKAIHDKDIVFTNHDFLELDLSGISSGDFVYCDPPYLISTGSYNDGKRGFKDWSLEEERALLALLDDLNARGIRFALSNVLYHKGQSNKTLIEWSEKYNVNYIDSDYTNCNYHLKTNKTKTVEVVITNY